MDRWNIVVFVQVCKGLYSNLPKSGYILERNMHFVVANIVTPLTQSKGVSFVTLWGGRRVDYFVPLDPFFGKFLNMMCFISFQGLCSLCPILLQNASLAFLCVLGKVPFLGHQFSALCAVHSVPCAVQRGPQFLDGCSVLDLFVCSLEEITNTSSQLFFF